MQTLARLSLSLVLDRFVLAAITGLLMSGTQYQELLSNRVFVAKMALLMLAGRSASWFHGQRSFQRLDRSAKLSMRLPALL